MPTKRLPQFIKQEGNSGSALVTVIVSMVFIIALGTSLLFAAYASFSIQLAQRSDKVNFYRAETVMDEVRLGVQTLLSDSMASAYTALMVQPNYLELAPAAVQTAFANGIVTELDNNKTPNYFDLDPTSGELIAYDPEALITFVSAAQAANTKITGTGAVICVYDDNDTLVSFSLKGVSVQYISNGFESNITSDITVTLPDFYTSATLSTAVNNYAIIANNALIHETDSDAFADVTIDGSVFVGSGGIDLGGNGYKLTFKNCNLINKGLISLSDSAALNFTSSNYELWTKGISVGNSCAVTLDGKIHVADDLEVNGSGSTVTLKNSYFGFGNSTTTADGSSAILINGRNSTLDINGLSKLSLAGISFIAVANSVTDTSGNKFVSDIPMGQSMSVRTDQLAYLIPVTCIKNYAANPCVLGNSENRTPDIDLNAVLWTTSTGPKTLADYIGSGTEHITTLYKPLDSLNRVAYVFFLFSDKAAANAYFKDYFAADPSKIQQYLDLYLTLTTKASDAKVNAIGSTYELDDKGTPVATDDVLALAPAGNGVWADGEQLLYNRMSSPYPSFVNKSKLNDLSNKTLEFKDADDKVVAIVSTEDSYQYDGDADPNTSIRLIISSKDVRVSKVFTGIIIAGGTVYANKNISGSPVDATIMDATFTDGVTRYTLSDFLNNSAQFGSASGSSSDQWNLDTLVYYENWNKH